MARIVWDASGEKDFQIGVDRGVLYVSNHPGVPWNGLTTITEAPDGGDATGYFIDGIKYLNVASKEDFKATLEAYTYPEEFEACEGMATIYGRLRATGQRRRPFGLSYRSKVGNDVEGVDHGYKIHLVYNALAAPSQRQNSSINDSPEPQTFSWDLTTTPAVVTGFKRTAHFVVDSKETPAVTLSALEDILYGNNDLTPRLPEVSELFDIFAANSTFKVIDHGDGSFTVEGTDEEVFMIDGTSFEIDSAGATILDGESYRLTSP